MARKKMQATKAANFRFPPSVVKELDSITEQLTATDTTGRRWTRTDLVLACLKSCVPKLRQGIIPWEAEAS